MACCCIGCCYSPQLLTQVLHSVPTNKENNRKRKERIPPPHTSLPSLLPRTPSFLLLRPLTPGSRCSLAIGCIKRSQRSPPSLLVLLHCWFSVFKNFFTTCRERRRGRREFLTTRREGGRGFKYGFLNKKKKTMEIPKLIFIRSQCKRKPEN